MFRSVAVLRRMDSMTDGTEMEVSVSSAEEKLDREKQKKAAIAAKRREKIMKQMAHAQRNFIADNSELFESTSTADLSRVTSDVEMSSTTNLASRIIALGPKRNDPHIVSGASMYTCILCQEEEHVSVTGRTIVVAAFIQKYSCTLLNLEENLMFPFFCHAYYFSV